MSEIIIIFMININVEYALLFFLLPHRRTVCHKYTDVKKCIVEGEGKVNTSY